MTANKEFYCKNHPDRIGQVDVGEGEENRYPCWDCYHALCRERECRTKRDNVKNANERWP